MLRMPSCLLKLTRVMLNHRLGALFIIVFKFLSFASILLYWRITEDPKVRGQVYSLPVEIRCARSVPSPPRAAAGGPPPPPGDVFFVETSERTNPNYLFMCSVESAARTHPGTRVVVLMKGLANRNTSLPSHWGFSLLSCFPNVEIRPLDLQEDKLHNRGNPPHFIAMLSNVQRSAINLCKPAGIYIDTGGIFLWILKNPTTVLGVQLGDLLTDIFLILNPNSHTWNYTCWVLYSFIRACIIQLVFQEDASSWVSKSRKAAKDSVLFLKQHFIPLLQNWKKVLEAINSTEFSEFLRNIYATFGCTTSKILLREKLCYIVTMIWRSS
uniref:Uncharacterized protein n=1 Tax=Apteryx owenii TaxID=8824 RepID=A0A8B9QKZ5_APTOW